MKKFVLVDPIAYQNNSQQCARPSEAGGLDAQIREILNDPTKPDDVKVKLYAQALTKHTAPIAHQQQQQQQPPSVDYSSEVLDSVPIAARHKAKRILRELNANPAVNIEPSGRFVYKQSPIENSNIVDLVVDLLRDKKIETGAEPAGWREFAQSLAKLEKYYVPNTRSWKFLSEGATTKRPQQKPIARRSTILTRRAAKQRKLDSGSSISKLPVAKGSTILARRSAHKRKLDSHSGKSKLSTPRWLSFDSSAEQPFSSTLLKQTFNV